MKCEHSFCSWLLAPIYLAVAGCMGYAPGEKIYWDSRVSEMCQKDGGTKVFEVVEISKSEYLANLNKLGHFNIPLDTPAAHNALIVHRFTRTDIREGNPSVSRYELAVIRRSDQKLLGTQITYSRVGGDIPSPAHPSSFTCPDAQIDLFSAVVRSRTE